MKVRLSEEAVFNISRAVIKDIQQDVNSLSESNIALNDTFEKKANDIIHKFVVMKTINLGFLEARKELELEK